MVSSATPLQTSVAKRHRQSSGEGADAVTRKKEQKPEPSAESNKIFRGRAISAVISFVGCVPRTKQQLRERSEEPN
jgi:hypothetical protein